MLSNLIPVQYRYAAIAGAFAVVVTISFAAGWNVSSWRSEAVNAIVLRRLEGELSVERLKVAEMNGRNLALDAQARASDAARVEAESRLAQAERSRSVRVTKVATMKATGCDDAIGQYWEMRK